MKYQSNILWSPVKTAAVRSSKFLHLTLAIIATFLALNATAAVQVTRFDPPLAINAFSEVPDDLLLNVLATDFNADGDVDFRLAYGFGGIGAYFNHPTRFGRKVQQPGITVIGGPVGAVPLCSVIGSNIVSAIATNYYVWAPGYTNRYDLTQPFGNHEATVIIANLTTGLPGPYPVISISTNGTLITNIYHGGPVVSGDVARKEAVMALEFYITGQKHYGYIHFDFRAPAGTLLGGAGGVVYGWAYETEPGASIKAAPLSPDNDEDDHKGHPGWNDHKGRGRSSR